MKQRAFFGDDKNAAVATDMGPVEAYWKRKKERKMQAPDPKAPPLLKVWDIFEGF